MVARFRITRAASATSQLLKVRSPLVELAPSGQTVAFLTWAALALVFDGQHGAQQQILVGNIAINLDANGNGDISAGYQGGGSLRIADGVTVPCNSASVNFGAGSNVAAIVTGNGSTWKYNTGM